MADATFNPAYQVARCGQLSTHAPHIVEHGPDQPRNCPGTSATITEPNVWAEYATSRRDELGRLKRELAISEAACASAMAEVEALKADLAEARTERDRAWALIQTARDAARRISAALVANASRLDTPFSNDPRTPWTLHISPAINQLRRALGMRGAWPVGCTCDLHNRNCEPPSELCCENCSESQHPLHADGSACSAPDLSGNHMPTAVELALRAEIDRLGTVVAVARLGEVLDGGT